MFCSGGEIGSELKFDVDGVHISGLIDSVEKVEKIVNDKIISRLCNEKVETVFPGNSHLHYSPNPI